MTRAFMKDPDPNSGNAAVEKGTYTVEVVDARPLENRDDFLWLDLRIIGGPDDGTLVSVSLNMPTDTSSRGAQFFFKKKVRGFVARTPQVFTLPDEEQAAALSQALIGARVEADLSVQTEGQYKGSQQLDETREIVDVRPAGVPQTQTQPAAQSVSTTVSVEPTLDEADPPF